MPLTYLALFQTEMVAHVSFAAEPDQICYQQPRWSIVRLFFLLSLSIPILNQ